MYQSPHFISNMWPFLGGEDILCLDSDFGQGWSHTVHPGSSWCSWCLSCFITLVTSSSYSAILSYILSCILPSNKPAPKQESLPSLHLSPDPVSCVSCSESRCWRAHWSVLRMTGWRFHVAFLSKTVKLELEMIISGSSAPPMSSVYGH